jgi:hypothetical protein
MLRISYLEFQKENIETIIKLFINKNFDALLNYNILLINNKHIFNEKSYYVPTKITLIQLLVENLLNCGKPLRV